MRCKAVVLLLVDAPFVSGFLLGSLFCGVVLGGLF